MINQVVPNDDFLVVMPITDNLEELEAAWERYQSLTIDFMQLSDDKAIEKYGLNNRTLYQKQKAWILINMTNPVELSDYENNDTIVSEGFAVDYDIEHKDDTLKSRIEKARSLQSDTCVIIYPISIEYPYTIDDLNDAFTRYNNLSWDLKQMSDQESIKLFGNDVHNMYQICKNQLLSLMDTAPDIFDPDEIQDDYNPRNIYFEAVSKQARTDIFVNTLLERKAQLIDLKNSDSLLEINIATDSLTDIEDALIKSRELSDCVPEFTPFFTPAELVTILGDDLTDEDQTYARSLENALANGLKGFDGKAYYKKLKEASQTDNQSYNINMVRLGWNPNLKLNEDNFKFARSRMIRYINEYYHINLINMLNKSVPLDEGKTNSITFDLKPVFLVVYKDECFITNHPELTFLYTDEDVKYTLAQLDDNAKIEVYTVFIDSSAFEEFTKHMNDARMISPLFSDLRNNIQDRKHLCASFVNLVCNITNGDRVNDPKVYYIFSDYKIKYTADYIIPIIKAILSDSLGLVMRKYTNQEAIHKLVIDPSIATYKAIQCNEPNNDPNDIIENFKFLYTGSSIISEAKSIPVRLSSKGMVIDLPTRIEEEYQNIHKALLVYEEAKNYEAMKDSLAHLWYLNLLCERKINKLKDKDNKEVKLKVNRNTRARILNDFKKYLKLVVKNDKNFDFTSYFTKSKYNDRSLFINMDTLKYTGKVVAAVVKSLLHKKP